MFTWRPVRESDYPLLARWLSEPHVHRWWFHESSLDAVERDFGPAVRGAEPGEDLLCFSDRTAIGLVQRSFLRDYPEYRDELAAVTPVPASAMTIDYLVGDPGLVGRGVGTAMIRAAVAAVWQDHEEASALIVAVHAANAGSWRVLEKAGFTLAGTGELKPDNAADDPLHRVYRLERPR